MSKKPKSGEEFEQDGQKYLRVGDKAVPFDEYDESGNPKLDPEVEKDEDGNVTVKMPCLKIKGEEQDL